jgi:hypothetical protein
MALSSQVKECVDDATASIRNALAFAARSEQALTINSLTDVLMRLESLEHMDELVSKFAKQKELPKPGIQLQ